MGCFQKVGSREEKDLDLILKEGLTVLRIDRRVQVQNLENCFKRLLQLSR